jgi:hypothetical protein
MADGEPGETGPYATFRGVGCRSFAYQGTDEKGSTVTRWFSTSRRRLGAVSAGVLLAAAVAGCTPSVSDGPSGSADAVSTADEIIVVCESEVVSKDGIETSSSFAVKLPAGSPIPPGCHLA